MAQPQEYSPTAVQPYEAAAPPPTPEAKPSPVQDSPGFQFQGHGNISHAGAIAGVFDNVLKGFVNGHAMGEAHKALTLKKKSDDLNQSYNQDAQRLYQMHASGVDEKSPEYQAAKSAVSGSWGALQDFRGSLIDQQGGGKKKPSKGVKTGQDDPLLALTNPQASPQEKAAAMLAMSKKLGPPVYGQIAQLSTPQAKQARATQQTGADTTQATGETNNKLATMASQIATLSTKEKLSSEEETQLGDLKKRYTDLNATLHPQKMTATSGHRFSDDGKEQYEVDAQGNEIENTRRPRSSAQAPKPRAAWGKDEKGKYYSVLLDPQTNKEVPESRNFSVQPPASVAGSIKTGQHFWQDANNNVVETPYTTTSRPAGGGTPSAAPPAAAPGTPTTAQPAATTPATGGLTRRMKTPPSSATPSGAPPVPTGDASGSKILGHAKISGPDAKEQSDANTKYHNALTALQASRNAVAAWRNGQNDSLADKGLAEAWVRSHQGRVTQKTLDQVNSLGGMKLKWDGTKTQILEGSMSPEQRALFARDAAEEYHDTLGNLNDVRKRLNLPPIEPPSFKKTTKAAKPERPQGVPPAFVYFQASDGNGHWIDPSKLDAAKKIDPKLQVIQ